MKCLETLLSQFRAVFVITLCLLSFSAARSQIALTRALDYDGDGKADFTVFRSNLNIWYTDVSGGGFLGTVWGVAGQDTLTPGDYDGDGKGDICVWRASDGVWYRISSSNGTFVSTTFGMAGDQPIARDYDGDGKTDLAFVRRAGDYLYWYILQSSNGAVLIFQYGVSSDSPIPGDYDGDGHFDIAVQRQDIINHTLTLYLHQSLLGDISFQNYGADTDLIVPGDYDGDGKTDIAACRWEYRNGDNYEWRIAFSSNGTSQTIEWGRADMGDMPVQADYDGDGKTDLAIWRSTERKYYVNQSSNGQPIYLQWGSGGDLPLANYDTH